MKFSIKDFFSKCGQIRRKLRIWSHLLKKSLIKTSFFVQGYSFKIQVALLITNSSWWIKFMQQKKSLTLLVLTRGKNALPLII